jgi:hypothetical protein
MRGESEVEGQRISDDSQGGAERVPDGIWTQTQTIAPAGWVPSRPAQAHLFARLTLTSPFVVLSYVPKYVQSSKNVLPEYDLTSGVVPVATAPRVRARTIASAMLRAYISDDEMQMGDGMVDQLRSSR